MEFDPGKVSRKRRRHHPKKKALAPDATIIPPDEASQSSTAATERPRTTAQTETSIPPRKSATRAPPVISASDSIPTPTPAVASLHPFDTDPHDHAETPFTAYADIEPLLFGLALQLRSNKARLKIWDPYYCEGSCVKHLGSLGFSGVRNVNEDFYETIAACREPPFDVLVTNPPFSGDHMERFLTYLATLDRPWFALMPQFVAQKRYFFEWKAAAVASGREVPVYIGPSRAAYAFTAPALAADGASALVPDATEGRRVVQDGVRVFAGKFQCVWFACLGSHRAAVLSWWQRKYSGRPGVTATLVEDDPLNLPQLVHAKKPAPAERRWRKKLHRLHKRQQQQGGEPESIVGRTDDETGSTGAKEVEEAVDVRKRRRP